MLVTTKLSYNTNPGLACACLAWPGLACQLYACSWAGGMLAGRSCPLDGTFGVPGCLEAAARHAPSGSWVGARARREWQHPSSIVGMHMAVMAAEHQQWRIVALKISPGLIIAIAQPWCRSRPGSSHNEVEACAVYSMQCA